MKRREIGSRLTELRAERSQMEVAEAIGITQAALSMYERGERVPRDDLKIKLADYYGKTVSDIFFN